nr:sensor histidine kinase [Phytoactinopolyspora alkaliphila]
MAQELHDSVGHGLAVIAMQAGVALHVLDRNPAKARQTLEAIRDASRESLESLRAELNVLRTPEGDPAPRRAGLGMDDAGVLLDRIRAGGVTVDADIQVRHLPPDVDLAAYRILQESLTNVLRHARATRAGVRVRQDDDVVLLDVADDGAGSGPLSPDGHRGTGIAGMTARAVALGGELVAGPRPDGGFAVHARLPVPAGHGLPAAGMPGSAP